MLSALRHIILLAAILPAILLAGCSESDHEPVPEGRPGTLTICLTTDAHSVSRAAADSPDNLSQATAGERVINDLRYFIFPTGSTPAANFSAGRLTPPPTTDESADEKYKEYQIDDILPGSYKVYVVANMPSVADVTTETQLKKEIIEYTPESLPRPGQIPMVYEPQEVTEMKPGGTVVMAGLRFTCVKVRYNLIFDKDNNTATASSFGAHGLLIDKITARTLTSATPLVLGGAMDALVSKAEPFDAPLAAGEYFAEWSREDNAADNEDVISSFSGKPEKYSSRWVYTGTVYLPERYVGSDDDQCLLEIDAYTVDGDLAFGGERGAAPKNTYRINLGHTSGAGQPRQFPRGTYYEIIGSIESTNITGIETDVRIKDWEPVYMADLGHTTLTVDKTSAKVTSIDTDSIRYTSNRSEVILGTDVMVDGKPIIVQYRQDTENGILSFRINPEIPISAFGTEVPTDGKTKIWIQAGNLRKYIDVEYNVEPLFEVTPVEAVINWNKDEPSSSAHTKTFHYQTNLGGIKGIEFGKDYTNGHSVIRFECTDPTASTGTFTVTATTDPVTTTEQYFTVSPMEDYLDMAKEIMVRVKPPLGPYRIYFRAINDNQGENSDATTQYLSPLEEGSLNREDGWDTVHKLYCYTQMGETVNGTIPDYYVWRFLGAWPGQNMTHDMTNPGWFYYDIAEDAVAQNEDVKDDKGNIIYTGDGTKKKIKPGETLLMFNSGGDGVHRHRCPHHLDAGLQLFDYEDREGWVLYDPLCEPYYKVYDVHPEIENIRYTVYSRSKVTGWSISYGMSNANTKSPYTITNPTLDNNGMDGAWHVCKMEFKAPNDDYAKSIVLSFEDGSESMLYGGANYYNRSTPGEAVGYYWGIWSREELLSPPSDPEIPAGHRRIWYTNPDNMSPLYIHYWDSDKKGTSWPGVSMKFSYVKNMAYYDIPENMVGLIFNNGSGIKTNDITVNTNEKEHTYTDSKK